jgi:dTDP-4-dehydrorhamnose 3,5-epimerase
MAVACQRGRHDPLGRQVERHYQGLIRARKRPPLAHFRLNRYSTRLRGDSHRGDQGGERMDVTTTALSGVLILKPRRFHDPRGFFCETYNRQRLEGAGIRTDFVQDNVSVSNSPGTLRGLHFQREPFAQAKLVSVMQGKVLDVIVDLRRGSPTFGRHISIQLGAGEGNQVFIPIGFAHGFLTQEPDTMICYKVSNFYSPEHDSGIRFDDERLGIEWNIDHSSIVTSEKDRTLPPFDPEAAYFP